SAGFNPDFADDGNSTIPHGLVLTVGKGLSRSDGDRVAGVHAHGIEVLNRTDDDNVVAQVAHDFELVLFPSEDRLFDQSLVYWREVETTGEDIEQLFAVVGDAAAASAQREAWAHNNRKADFSGEFEAIFQVVDQG